MKHFFLISCLAMGSIAAKESSASMHCQTYIEELHSALESEEAFNQFKRLNTILGVFHSVSYDMGEEYLSLIEKDFPHLIPLFEEFRENDLVGNPYTTTYGEYGEFSPATLRYIGIAGDICQKFPDLPQQPHICEIGSGYGGQCLILSKLFNYNMYSAIDIPEALALTEKYLNIFQIENMNYISCEERSLELTSDLFISNYAFSECSRDLQERYFHAYMKHAKRGYLIFNYRGAKSAGFPPEELVLMLREEGHQATIHKEPVETATVRPNVLITWGDTSH